MRSFDFIETKVVCFSDTFGVDQIMLILVF